MAGQYNKPGVYTERFDASAPGIAGVRTDVTAFVGIAERGPLDTPVPVESYRQFQAHFGATIGSGYLAYAVRGFFENGGRRCWIVRVACRDEGTGARPARVRVGLAGGTELTLLASSPGGWGNRLSAALSAQRPAQTLGTPDETAGHYAEVASVAGFHRGDLVQIVSGASSHWRVLSHIDPLGSRLYWVHPEPGQGLPYDRSLPGHILGDLHILNWRLGIQVFDLGKLVATFGGLGVVPEGRDYIEQVLGQPQYRASSHTESLAPAVAPPLVARLEHANASLPAALNFIDGERHELSGGTEGLAKLSADDFIGEPFDPRDSDLVRARKARGIHALSPVNEVALLAIPDISIRPLPAPEFLVVETPPRNPCIDCPPPPEPTAGPHQPEPRGELPPVFSEADIFLVQAAAVEQCELRGDRFAVLDAPFSAVTREDGIAAIKAWRSKFDSPYAAIYFPWLDVVDPITGRGLRRIPPCGHVTGTFAWHDIEIGVHRAPANRHLRWTQGSSWDLDDGRHAVLNMDAVNVIRAEGARGLRIMGARTLSSDPDWRFVNVRRLVTMVRKALDRSTQWAVFEPNDFSTRSKITLAVTEFLTALWQRGALAGATPEASFFVKCDEENNPEEDRDRGLLSVVVGLAASKPFEFVVLRIGRQGNALRMAETTMRRVA